MKRAPIGGRLFRIAQLWQFVMMDWIIMISSLSGRWLHHRADVERNDATSGLRSPLTFFEFDISRVESVQACRVSASEKRKSRDPLPPWRFPHTHVAPRPRILRIQPKANSSIMVDPETDTRNG